MIVERYVVNRALEEWYGKKGMLTAREKRAYCYGDVPAADDALAPYSPSKKGIWAVHPRRRGGGGDGGVGSGVYGLSDLDIFTPPH